MNSFNCKHANLSKKWSVPTGLSVDLRFFNEFECNLALPSTTEAVQDEDVTLPQIAREVCAHLSENIFSAGKDWCRRRATLQACARGWRRVGQWGI